MKPAPAGSLLTYLSQVPDPRGRQGRRHSLEAMLASVVCAMLQGARGYAAISQWVHSQDVESVARLGVHPPATSTGRFSQAVDGTFADAFRACASGLGQALFGSVQIRPVSGCCREIDGKTLCGTLQPHERAVHLLALLDQRTGCVLSQSRVDAKTNEHKGALELLKTLVLEGRVITGDAMFCQRDVCKEIRDRGGHYFFVVKDNQPKLKESIAAEFKAAFSPYERTAAAGAS